METDISILMLVAGLAVLLGLITLSTIQSHHAKVNRRLTRIMDHLGVQEYDGDISQVGVLARQGKTIEAVRLHRKLTGSSLREAKEAVDRLLG